MMIRRASDRFLYGFVHAALRPLQPVDAVLFSHANTMVIRLTRAPGRRRETWRIRWAMLMLRTKSVRHWILSGTPAPWYETFLAIKFADYMSCAEVRLLRVSLGLYYLWYATIDDQGPDAIVVDIGESDRHKDPTEIGPELDLEQLAQIAGVRQLTLVNPYPKPRLKIEAAPGHKVVEVAREVCAAASAFLDVDAYQPPPGWDRR